MHESSRDVGPGRLRVAIASSVGGRQDRLDALVGGEEGSGRRQSGDYDAPHALVDASVQLAIVLVQAGVVGTLEASLYCIERVYWSKTRVLEESLVGGLLWMTCRCIPTRSTLKACRNEESAG